MKTIFNFSSLSSVYHEAFEGERPTVVFEIEHGVGRFVFMIFCSEEDKGYTDDLFLYLARTNVLIPLKMYGNHSKGDFKVYLEEKEERYIRDELNIQPGTSPFILSEFLNKLNLLIPKTLPLPNVIGTMKRHRTLFETNAVLKTKIDVSEASKIYLIGPKRLASGKKPQEKTLRKLYLYVDADPHTITEFINALKKAGRTVAWTDDKSKIKRGIREMIANINDDGEQI
jgi:hypothetical protein